MSTRPGLLVGVSRHTVSQEEEMQRQRSLAAPSQIWILLDQGNREWLEGAAG